jgi:hypothetical protein
VKAKRPQGLLTLRLSSTRGMPEVEGRLWAAAPGPLLLLLQQDGPVELGDLCPVLAGQIAVTAVESAGEDEQAVATVLSMGAITAFGLSFERVAEWCVAPQFRVILPGE